MRPAPHRSLGPRQVIALLLLGLPLFMMATDFTTIFLAMPALGADLAPSATQSLWIVHVGELVAAGSVITMGWLTGRFGPRTLLLVALPVYGLASACAAFAENAEVLIAARIVIGLASAAAGPATFAMLRWMFTTPGQYGVAFAVVMGAFPVGTALGPPLTGLLLEHFEWGSVFLINTPVAAVAVLGGLWLFPRTPERSAQRLDVASVALSMAAVMLAVHGLQEVADRGLSLGPALSVPAAVLLGAWFVRRQRRLADPLLDPVLFTAPMMRLLTLFFLLIHVSFVAIDYVLIQYLQIVLALPPGVLGLVLTLPGLAAIISTALTPAVSSRLRPASMMAGGMGLGLTGAALILTGLVLAPATVLIATGMTLMAFSMSPLMVLATQLMITSVSRSRAGPAAAIQDIGASLGSALGIMLLGSLAGVVFGRGMRSAGRDGEDGTGTESLGAALSRAEDLGGERGEALLLAVREAWSLGTVAAVALALALGAATLVVMVRGLRGVQVPEQQEPSSNVLVKDR